MNLKLVTSTVLITFFTFFAIGLWRLQICIIFCSDSFSFRGGAFFGVDLLIYLIGLLGIFLVLRPHFFWYKKEHEEKEGVQKKLFKYPLVVIPIMILIAIFARNLEFMVTSHGNSTRKSVTVSNIVDRPVGFIDGLPIGIEFEYTIKVERSAVHSLLYKIFATDFDQDRNHYLDPFDFRPAAVRLFGDTYSSRTFPSDSDDGFNDRSVSVVSIVTEPRNGFAGQQKPVQPFGLGDSRNLESGKEYRVVARILPNFFNISYKVSDTQDQFMKEFKVMDQAYAAKPMCITPNLESYNPSEITRQLRVFIAQHWFQTSNYSYNLSEFYRNAIASGIPFCEEKGYFEF